jgi:hypothetical protein
MHSAINERRRFMKSDRSVALIIVMLAAIVIVAAPAVAQDKPADNMQIVLEKIRADKKLLVAENMQLTEAEAKVFWPVYDQYQDELFLLRTRTAKLIKGSGIEISGNIGFPFGSHLTEVKALETKRAVEAGATQIDMVINVGALRSKKRRFSHGGYPESGGSCRRTAC